MNIDKITDSLKIALNIINKQDMNDMSWNSVQGWVSSAFRELNKLHPKQTMKWIDLDVESPPPRDCDKGSYSGYSEKIIVTDGKNVWDDVRMVWYYDDTDDNKLKFHFASGVFGYGYDSQKLTNITHWMLLPKPPKK